MARIVVMSEPSVDRDYGVITLDENVAPARLEKGYQSAQLIERVGWALHDAEDARAAQRMPARRRPNSRNRARKEVPPMEANATWLVEFAGAKLSGSDKRSLASRHIAVLTPGLAAISQPLGEPSSPRNQCAWVVAPTRGHAVAMVDSALSAIGAYTAFSASRAR